MSLATPMFVFSSCRRRHMLRLWSVCLFRADHVNHLGMRIMNVHLFPTDSDHLNLLFSLAHEEKVAPGLLVPGANHFPEPYCRLPSRATAVERGVPLGSVTDVNRPRICLMQSSNAVFNVTLRIATPDA